MILSLQTNSFGSYGGIPTYNRLVCRVLNDSNFRSVNRVLIAMDDPRPVESAAAFHPSLHMSAFGGRRAAFAKAALTMAAREPIDVVLAGHVNYAPLCTLLKRLQPQLRYGVFIYGCEVWDRMPLLRKAAAQHADFLIAISEYTKRQAVRSNNLLEERIFLLPNALEWTNGTVASPARRTPFSGIKLLSVGRLDSTEQRKGFDTVIESLPAVIERVPDVQYLIVGGGSDLERHKQLASRVGVSDRVHFLGTVPEDLLHDCYKSCDVFVMPSAQEGFGFVYLEAMQYRKPIVAANRGGAPEVVQDGINGKLIDYGNKQQLAETLIDLCLDPDTRRKLGDAGYQRLQQNFTFAHFKQKFMDILRLKSHSHPVHEGVLPRESNSCAS
ncbi:MAG: glycosyltransferase family 4 protein [Pyrinomonadaceae bacterium]